MIIFAVGGMRGVDKHSFIVKQNYVCITQAENADIKCNLEISATYKDLKDYQKIVSVIDGIANSMSKRKSIKEVIFNNPATIILWADGTKTVVKCKDGDKYDKQTGFLICYLKGIVGNKTLLKEIDKWVGNNGKD